MNRKIYLALAVALTLPAAQAAQVQGMPITVPNFSFESTAAPLGDGGFTSTNVNGNTTEVPGWVFNATIPGSGTAPTAGIYNSVDTVFTGTNGASSPLPAPAAGPQLAYVHLNSSTTAQAATLTSDSSLATIQANSTYSLAIAIGNRKDALNPANVEIALLADGVPVVGALSTLDGTTVPKDSFVDLTASFTTALVGDPLVGKALTIRFTHTKDNATTAKYIVLDNVRLSVEEVPVPPAPEPSSAALLLIGCGALAMVRRRKENRVRL